MLAHPTFQPIVRERVVQRILNAAAYPVTLIVAPAGYGKSVALRHALERMDVPNVRFDVRPEHGTFTSFMRGFCEAFSHLAPQMVAALPDALRKQQGGVDLASWVVTHLKDFRGVIALDDLHHADDEEVAQFLRLAMSPLDGAVRWIIATRSIPELPVASWTAYGTMDLAVDERDLAFTLEEVKGAVTGAQDEELTRFIQMTGGWATALSFAFRRHGSATDMPSIGPAARELVYRYLAEQVYDELSEREREMLQLAAFLPQIEVKLLVAAGFPDALAILESLRRSAAFLSVESEGVYRCHDLFRDFLKYQVHLQGSDKARATHLCAADLLIRAGQIEAALHAYVEEQAESQVLQILECHGFALVDSSRRDAIDRAILVLAPEVSTCNPIILALRAVRETDKGRFDKAEPLFLRAMQSSSDAVLRAEIAARLADVHFSEGRSVIELLKPFLAEPLPLATEAKIVSYLAPAFAYAGLIDEARQLMTHAEEFIKRIDCDRLRAKIFHRLGITALVLMEPSQVVSSLFLKAYELAYEQSAYFTATAALSGLANMAALYEGDSVQGSVYSDRAILVAEQSGDRFSLQQALLYSLHFESQLGNVDRVAGLLDRLSGATTSDETRKQFGNATRAMLSAWRGRFEEAYRLNPPDTSFYNFDRVFYRAVASVYALAAGYDAEADVLARRTVEEIYSETFRYTRARRIAEIARLLCAASRALAGRTATAKRILRGSGIAQGPPVEAMRLVVETLLDINKGVSARARAFDRLAALSDTGYGGLALVLKRAVERIVPEISALPELTYAEKSVLNALYNGRNPKEIAADTGRSVHTVRTLIQRASEKLNCSGRQQTLAEARRLGLLVP